jgi:hypothetical protein
MVEARAISVQRHVVTGWLQMKLSDSEECSIDSINNAAALAVA